MEQKNINKISLLKKIINHTSENDIVFFGGAGVSTESGIPDFRSKDGLYNLKYKYPPETIISHDFFINHTDEFYKFYFDKMIPDKNIKPNITHIKLAKWQNQGILKSIITQNIDGLHQLAGSKNVLELHGSILRNYCTKCNKFYSLKMLKERYNLSDNNVPLCDNCNNVIKPDVVLYQEALDNSIMYNSIQDISKAKTLIIAGTSLAVYPAAGLLDYFRGNNLIIINKQATNKDKYADICINESLGEVFDLL